MHLPRKYLALFLALPLLLLPFLLSAFLVGELYYRWLGPDQIPPFSPCLGFDEKLRQRYRPNCSFSAVSAQGEVTYSYNEDGLRDRPRSFFRKGALVALGDSVTEGLFLSEEQTVPRMIERAVGATTLNAGIRFTSPSLHILSFESLIQTHYPVKGVIWLLNESDVSDERLFYAEGLSFNEQGLPNRFPWLGASGFWGKLLTGISRWNQGRSQLLNVMVRLETFRTYSRRLGASTQPPDILCRAIKTFSEKLREKKIPLLIVFTPHPDRGISANWPGYRYQREELLSMVACAKASGFPLLDLTNDPIKADWYAADEIHFSPAGSKWLADRIAPSVKKWMETP